MEEVIRKEHIKTKSTWIRAVYILVFWFAYSVAEFVLGATVLFQFLFVLFTGEKNEKLLLLGQDLSQYIYQLNQFLTFNTDEKPFPFSDWPSITRKYPENES